MQIATILDLEQLCVTYRTSTDTDSGQGTHFTSREVQEWADKNDTLALPPALQPHSCRAMNGLKQL